MKYIFDEILYVYIGGWQTEQRPAVMAIGVSRAGINYARLHSGKLENPNASFSFLACLAKPRSRLFRCARKPMKFLS